MSWKLKVVIEPSSEEEMNELLEKYGTKASIYGQDSYSGVMVCCDNEDDFKRLESQQDYAEQRIIETTTNF